MAEEEQGPFGLDDDDEEAEYVISIDPDQFGRKHGRWTVIAEVLDCASGIHLAVAEMFLNLSRASSQHGIRDVATREFHEAVAQEIERIPVKDDTDE